MIAFRHWFAPSLTAPRRRIWELDAAVTGNTLTPVNANQDHWTLLRELAGSTCLWGTGRNKVNRQVKRAIRLPTIPMLRCVSMCGTDLNDPLAWQPSSQ